MNWTLGNGPNKQQRSGSRFADKRLKPADGINLSQRGLLGVLVLAFLTGFREASGSAALRTCFFRSEMFATAQLQKVSGLFSVPNI